MKHSGDIKLREKTTVECVDVAEIANVVMCKFRLSDDQFFLFFFLLRRSSNGYHHVVLTSLHALDANQVMTA